jgi:hypothetical protein
MLLEHADVATGTSEEQARHHPGRAAANDDEVGIAF